MRNRPSSALAAWAVVTFGPALAAMTGNLVAALARCRVDQDNGPDLCTIAGYDPGSVLYEVDVFGPLLAIAGPFIGPVTAALGAIYPAIE